MESCRFSFCRVCTTSAEQDFQYKNIFNLDARRCLMACAVATAVSCVFVVLGACHQFSSLGNTLAIAHGSCVLIIALGSVIACLKSRAQPGVSSGKVPCEITSTQMSPGSGSRAHNPNETQTSKRKLPISSQTSTTAQASCRSGVSSGKVLCEITSTQMSPGSGAHNPNAHLILTLEQTYEDAQNVAKEAVDFVNQELNVPDIKNFSGQDLIEHLQKYCPLVFGKFRLYEKKVKERKDLHEAHFLSYKACREDLEKCLKCLYVYIDWIVLWINTRASLMDEEQKLAFWSQHTGSNSALIKNMRYMIERLFDLKQGRTWAEGERKWVRGKEDKEYSKKLLCYYAPYFDMKDHNNMRHIVKKLCLATLLIVDKHCPPGTSEIVFGRLCRSRGRKYVETPDQLLYF